MKLISSLDLKKRKRLKTLLVNKADFYLIFFVAFCCLLGFLLFISIIFIVLCNLRFGFKSIIIIITIIIMGISRRTNLESS